MLEGFKGSLVFDPFLMIVLRVGLNQGVECSFRFCLEAMHFAVTFIVKPIYQAHNKMENQSETPFWGALETALAIKSLQRDWGGCRSRI